MRGGVAPPLAWAGILLLLGACTRESPAPGPSTAVVTCAVSRDPPNAAASAAALDAAKALQAQVQSGPLYQAAAARSALGACAWRYTDGSALAQDYDFRNGDKLRVQRDAGIEYSNQVLSLGQPLTDPPEALLKQAERASFGAPGCGIDWQTPPEPLPPAPSAEAGTVSAVVFRGSSCNCQARIHKNAAGQAVGLMLRSAC